MTYTITELTYIQGKYSFQDMKEIRKKKTQEGTIALPPTF